MDKIESVQLLGSNVLLPQHGLRSHLYQTFQVTGGKTTLNRMRKCLNPSKNKHLKNSSSDYIRILKWGRTSQIMISW